MAKNGTTWTYTYDANGMRTKRTNGSTTYSYVYNGSQLTQLTVNAAQMRFIYGGSSPVAMEYAGETYFYVFNLQGDVVTILDSSSTAVVNYSYDAWGNVLAISGTLADTVGVLNPFRYRGYVYDTETGLYYLQSRYYNPTWGRFLNADAFVSTGQGLLGNNMFAYCRNNPVKRIDVSGWYDLDIDDVDPIDDELEHEEGYLGGGTTTTDAKSSSSKSVPGATPYNPSGSSTPPEPLPSNAGISNTSPGHTPDQSALMQLVKAIVANAKNGQFITFDEAKILDEWAAEYNVTQKHTAFIGSGKHWRTGWDHTHIYKEHVPFLSKHG